MCNGHPRGQKPIKLYYYNPCNCHKERAAVRSATRGLFTNDVFYRVSGTRSTSTCRISISNFPNQIIGLESQVSMFFTSETSEIKVETRLG